MSRWTSILNRAVLWWPLPWLVLAAACVGAPTPLPPPTPTPLPTPTPTPLPDPRVIIDGAAEELLAVRALAFALDHPAGGSLMAPGLRLTRAEGVIDAPADSRGSFRLNLELEAAESFLKIDVISVGEAAFMTNLFDGQWEQIDPLAIPFPLDQTCRVIAGLLSGISAPRLVGVVDVTDRESPDAGYGAYHLQGTGPAAALADLIPGALPGAELLIDLWVDRTTGRLRRVQLTGPLVAGDPPDAMLILSLRVLEVPPKILNPLTNPPP